MILALSIMMALALALATLDLAWTIISDIMKPPFLRLGINKLLDIFGLFMIVMIGIELLETIMKSYICQGQPHYEVVLAVAIIAIARKIIILDFGVVDSFTLVGIAAVLISLTLGYYFMRKSQKSLPNRDQIIDECTLKEKSDI